MNNCGICVYWFPPEAVSSPRAGTTHSCCFNPSSHRVKKWRIDWETQMMRSYHTACQQHWNCVFSPMIWGRRQEERTGPRSFYSLINLFSSVQFSHSVVSDSLQTQELQHARPPCPSPTPGVYPNSCPLSWWCHPSHLLLSPSPPALNLSQHQSLFQWVSSSHQVAKVLEFQLQHQSFQWTSRTDLL